MSILVLGSSGQIGSEIVRHLRSLEHPVLEFDIKEHSSEDLRLQDNELLKYRLSKADFVFFLAFDVGGSKYLEIFQKTPEFISNNLRLMENTFNALKVSGKPFLFASTQMSNMSHSPYGVLKAIGEAYTRSLNGIIVKFWNTYGIEADDDKAHVITDFIHAAATLRKIPMRTDGLEERQFLHAEDCSRCLLTLKDNYAFIPRSEELHVTTFKWTRIIDIAHIVSKMFPGTEVVPGMATDLVQNGLKNEPSEAILKYWQPRIEVDEGIRKVASSMGHL